MYDDIRIPENIDEFVNKGIKKGKRKKRTNTLKAISGIFSCVLLTVFIAGIRVSPVFASNVAKIPVLNYLVEMVRLDKGLTAAVENEYIQHIGISDDKQSIVMTIKDIIADNSGLVIFYSLENKGNYHFPQIRNVKLTDSQGNELKLSSSYGFTPIEGKVYEDKIEFFTNENQKVIPDKVVLKTQIAVAENKEGREASVKDTFYSQSDISVDSRLISETWEIPFTIDKTRLFGAEKVYRINESIVIEGQKITFEDIKIYPIKSILAISLDKLNSKKIFAFDDLKLIDEKGEEWGRITNGFVGSNAGGDNQSLNFQSNYFTKPKELYIVGSSIRALDKDKCYFTVDTDKGKITYSPYDLLVLKNFSVNNETLDLQAEIIKESKDINNSFQISSEAFDSNGKKLDIISQGMGSTGKSSYMNYSLRLGRNFKGPVTFNICDYPSRIKGTFKIKIPLE